MIFCFSVKSVYWTVLCESEACAEPKKKLIHFICEESENGGEISSEYRMWLTIKLHKGYLHYNTSARMAHCCSIQSTISLGLSVTLLIKSCLSARKYNM